MKAIGKITGIDYQDNAGVILHVEREPFLDPFLSPPSHKPFSAPMPKKFIYSGRATIVIWDDGTKTVVKCSRHDDWSPDAGFLWALGERVYGSKAQLVKAMKEHASYEYKK